MTAVLELALRSLPQSVKPFPGEIMSSYIGRLADVNRLDTVALLRYITGTRQTHNVPVERLAIVAGVPPLVLKRAITDRDNAGSALKQYYSYGRSIEVRTEVSGPACQLCAAVAGATRPVACWRPAERVLCLRHRRWIGSDDALQPSLDRQPDILKAHMRHLRLVRRFDREEVTAAFTIAADICRQWHDYRQHDEEFRRRLEIFHGPDWQVALYHPTVAAAAYPQVVALARLLASPYWKSLGADSSATAASWCRHLRGSDQLGPPPASGQWTAGRITTSRCACSNGCCRSSGPSEAPCTTRSVGRSSITAPLVDWRHADRMLRPSRRRRHVVRAVGRPARFAAAHDILSRADMILPPQ
jgi:hypothetical protein